MDEHTTAALDEIIAAAELRHRAGGTLADHVARIMEERYEAGTLDRDTFFALAAAGYGDRIVEPADVITGPLVLTDDPAAPIAYDRPAGATVEPWTDDDTAELAEAMTAAAHLRRDAWTRIRWTAARWRRDRIERYELDAADLTTAAALSGLVPCDADDPRRARERGDVWAGIEAARAGKTTHEARFYETSDGFEERTRGGLRPIELAGL